MPAGLLDSEQSVSGSSAQISVPNPATEGALDLRPVRRAVCLGIAHRLLLHVHIRETLPVEQV